MWLFTTRGFLSVVAYDEGRDGDALPVPDGARPGDLLLVRARVFSDLTATLDALELPGSRAVSTSAADYPFRAVLTRAEWTRFLSIESQRIDYPNFKSRVQATQGSQRHDLYLRVWSVMRDLGTARPDTAGADSRLW